MRACQIAGFLAFACFVAVGCSNEPKRATVTGKVVVGEKAVTAGEVKFHGEQNALFTAQIQGDGTYTMADIPTGAVKLSVHPAPAMLATAGAPKGVTPIQTTGSGAVPPDPSKSPPIPIKYQNPGSSGLAVTLNAGNNTFDVNLTK